MTVLDKIEMGWQEERPKTPVSKNLSEPIRSYLDLK
jgi:hypothetical protein